MALRLSDEPHRCRAVGREWPPPLSWQNCCWQNGWIIGILRTACAIFGGFSIEQWLQKEENVS